MYRVERLEEGRGWRDLGTRATAGALDLARAHAAQGFEVRVVDASTGEVLMMVEPVRAALVRTSPPVGARGPATA